MAVKKLEPFDQVKIYISYSHSPSDRILVFDLVDYLKKKLSMTVGKVVTSDDLLFKDMIDGDYYKKRLTVGQLYSSGKRAVDITCDRKVTNDTDTWWHEFDKSAVKSANFILLMVSPDYLASDHCRSLMNRVQVREQEGLAKVVPIILRPVEWQPPPLWVPLPRNDQPVINWPDREEAFAVIAEGILQAIPAEVRKVWVDVDTTIPMMKASSPVAYLDEQVRLGLTVPTSISPGGEFVARFAAYVPRFRELVSQNLKLEARKAIQILDFLKCQWQVGTAVTVTLRSNQCHVAEPQKTFIWNGEWEILRFDVEVPPDVAEGTAILKFDVYIEGFVVASVRPEIAITAKATSASKQSQGMEMRLPRSAFASYSSQDREQVMGRIRSLQIVADIDVFVDCLSIRPGEEWENVLRNEIFNREMFWLFWSRGAMASKSVEWEWHTAYALKGKKYIQPHPLEPIDLAPPPKELEALQFGNAFEAYIYSLRSKQT